MLICVMRTTLHLPETLWRSAKECAAREGVTLTSVVEAALRRHLGLVAGGQPPRWRWRTESGSLLPGVDVDRRASLLDILDERP